MRVWIKAAIVAELPVDMPEGATQEDVKRRVAMMEPMLRDDVCAEGKWEYAITGCTPRGRNTLESQRELGLDGQWNDSQTSVPGGAF